MKNVSLNKTAIAERSGLTPRQVQFYTEQGIIVPEVDPGEGRGKTRLYSDHNLFQFGIIKVLVDLGLSVHKIKFIMDFLENQTVYREARAVFEKDNEIQLYVKFFSGDNYSVSYGGVRDPEQAILKPQDLENTSHCFVINLRAVHKMVG
jgi:DNA-binding transcriptional MerR regulator